MNNNEIDCFGDMCPVPMIKAQKKLEQIKIGESFKLITDHSCVIQSLRDKFENSDRVEFESEEVMNGVWEVVIIKKV